MDREKESLKALTVILKAATNITKMVKKDMNSYRVNTTEFMVLELIYNKGPQSIQIIGNRMLLASSSITYVIDQLEEKKFVRKIQDTKDRRIKLVSLTKKGNELMNEIFPKHSAVIKDLFDILSEKDLVELNENIKKVGYKAEEINDKMQE